MFFWAYSMCLCKTFGVELTLQWHKLIIELGNELWFYPKRFEIVYCSTGQWTMIILCIQSFQCDISKVVSKLLSVSSGAITCFIQNVLKLCIARPANELWLFYVFNHFNAIYPRLITELRLNCSIRAALNDRIENELRVEVRLKALLS